MKLALVSDLHGQNRTLDYIREILSKEKPDGLIISGDISCSGEIDFPQKLIETLSGVRSFLICGNADHSEAKQLLEETSLSIDQSCQFINKIKICGLSYPEENPMASEDLTGSIFVTHVPPVRALLEQEYPNAPKYHISGHLHKLAYVKKYKAAIHIQVPTLQDRRYVIFNPDTSNVEFKVLDLL